VPNPACARRPRARPARSLVIKAIGTTARARSGLITECCGDDRVAVKPRPRYAVNAALQFNSTGSTDQDHGQPAGTKSTTSCKGPYAYGSSQLRLEAGALIRTIHRARLDILRAAFSAPREDRPNEGSSVSVSVPGGPTALCPSTEASAKIHGARGLNLTTAKTTR